MIKLASSGCAYDSRVRLVTLEILIASLKLIVIRNDKSVLADEHFAAVEEAREESVLILRWDKYSKRGLELLEALQEFLQKRGDLPGYVRG